MDEYDDFDENYKNYQSNSYDDFIDKFYTFHLDEIIDIYYEFKQRFSLSPFFLAELKSTELTEFSIDSILNNLNLPKINDEYIEYFNYYYKNEIYTSYKIMARFLKTWKYNLTEKNWIIFCYIHTDLYEINKI